MLTEKEKQNIIIEMHHPFGTVTIIGKKLVVKVFNLTTYLQIIADPC